MTCHLPANVMPGRDKAFWSTWDSLPKAAVNPHSSSVIAASLNLPLTIG
jgi:hypothetical protein